MTCFPKSRCGGTFGEKEPAHDTDLAREVEFIAEHFYEIDDATLDNFKVAVTSQILAHKNLRLLNEGTLLDSF